MSHAAAASMSGYAAHGGSGGGSGGGGAGMWAAARSKVNAARDAETVANGNLKDLVANWKEKSAASNLRRW